MSRWTHRICADCYIDREEQLEQGLPPGLMHLPTRMIPSATPDMEDCCFCGATIVNVGKHGGIYVRHDPDFLECGGEHGST